MTQADLRGRLAADPEQVKAGTSTVTRLRVIADQTPAERTREEPAFGVDIEAWDDFGRALVQLRKGDPVIILGNWKVASWTDREGNRRTKSYVRAFAGGPDLSRSDITGLTRRSTTTSTPSPDPSPATETNPPTNAAAERPSSTGAPTAAASGTPAHNLAQNPAQNPPADPFDED